MLEKNDYTYLELSAKDAKFFIRVKSGSFKWEQLSFFISIFPSAEFIFSRQHRFSKEYRFSMMPTHNVHGYEYNYIKEN